MTMLSHDLPTVDVDSRDLDAYALMLACDPEAEVHHQDDEVPIEALETAEPGGYDSWPDWAQEERWETTDEADRLESAWEEAAEEDAFWQRLEALAVGPARGPAWGEPADP